MVAVVEAANDEGCTPSTRQGFWRLTGLICAAHFWSHFFQFLMPPLFPILKSYYGVSYTELGLLATAFYLASGLAQTPAGFVVDRYGAPRVLAAGLLLLTLAFAVIASAPPFAALPALMVLAGLGNSVFHPADYAILGHRIEPLRVGRAFALHTLAGTLGYAAAPVTMLALAQSMPWNQAILLPVIGAAVTGLLIVARRRSLSVEPAAVVAGSPASSSSGVRALLSPTVLGCFVFFVLSALPGVGVTGFLGPTLAARFDTPAAAAAAAVTALLIGSGVGTLVGGWIADHAGRPERVVLLGLAVATALVLAGAQWAVPVPVLIGTFGLAGFAAGLTTPSRDLIIRASARNGATGKVFGFVYSGYDIGSSLTPFLLGLLIDHAAAGWIVPLLAAGYAGMMIAVILTAGAGRRSVA